MGEILYYSNYCNNSKNLLQTLSKCQLNKDLHYVCIDKRVQKNDGNVYIVLENSQEIILPPSITRVPALLLLNKQNHIIFGEEIYNHLKPIENTLTQQIQNKDSEPTAYSLINSGYGVMSDNYSFLDQDSSDLSAKGNGGMRQLYNYATINQMDSINTPTDDYKADTIGNVSIDQLQQQRMTDIKK